MQTESPGAVKQQISAFAPGQRPSIKKPPTQLLPLLVLTHFPPSELHVDLFSRSAGMNFPFTVAPGFAIAMLRKGMMA
jgi:hypothetical protein